MSSEKKSRRRSPSPIQVLQKTDVYQQLKKNASNYLVPQKKKEEILARFRAEVDEQIEDELRYQMIRQAESEINTNIQNKMSQEKSMQKELKKRLTTMLGDMAPE